MFAAELDEHGLAAVGGDRLAALSGADHQPATKDGEVDEAAVMKMGHPHPVVEKGADDDEVGTETSGAVSRG
jgi:hypothetical protein